jgi:predicted membrane channel-forming protein YqfA (hemolysin III family)
VGFFWLLLGGVLFTMGIVFYGNRIFLYLLQWRG